ATIGAGHRKAVAVQMDRVIGHGEIADAHAHAIAKPYRQRIDPGEYAAVERPHIKIGHLGDLGQIGAGIDQIGAHDEDEVAVDAVELGVARMHHEYSHHAHGHLHHLVGVRVVHEGAALFQLELVDE